MNAINRKKLNENIPNKQRNTTLHKQKIGKQTREVESYTIRCLVASILGAYISGIKLTQIPVGCHI